jgi:DsbC/DsbD-like thiol-disulfide interchange protein
MLAQPRGFGHLLFAGRLGLGIALCLCALPAKSDPFASPWSGNQGDKAQMRLIAASREHGIYRVAAEIKLSPAAITYWRAPGDAGVPPQFSVKDSENVANAEILFPAPRRIDEQGIEAFGYRGGVVFPIHVAARDAAEPVRLRLTVAYAVCDNICLPVKSSAELILPKSVDSPEDAAIAAAEARVPLALAPKDLAEKLSVVSDKTAASPTWLLTWRGDFQPKDLFAEAPEGWVLETHRRADGLFSMVAVEQPLRAQRRVPVRLTLTGSQNAYEFMTELEVPAKSSALPVAPSKEQTMQAGRAIGTK